MPLDRLILPAPGIRVGFWKISEDAGTLLQMYEPGPEELSQITAMPEARQQHYLASRVLAKTLHPEFPIVKDSHGKPHLDGFEGGISWSHAGHFAAFISNSGQQTGIDIETLGPRILKIENKFCNKNDLALIHRTHHAESLLLIWGAKESIYKWYGKKEVDFRMHMTCHAFELHEEGRFTASLHLPHLQQDFLLEYAVFEGNIAVWILENEPKALKIN